MANDDKGKHEKDGGKLNPITFDELDDPSESSASSEIAEPTLQPVSRGGRVSGFFSRALSFSRRATADAKRMEIESVNELVSSRTDLQETVERATKQDARFEQLDNIQKAEGIKAVRDLDMEYREDMDDLDERASEIKRRRQEREAIDAEHELKTNRRKKHVELGQKRLAGAFAKGEPEEPVAQVSNAFHKRLNDVAVQAKKDISQIQANDDLSVNDKERQIEIVKAVQLQQERQAKDEYAKALARIKKSL